MSTKNAKKEKQEQHDFRLFAEHAGVSFVESTLKSNLSPAPDLEVELVGIGYRAFELGDLIPPNHHRARKYMEQGGALMTRHYEALGAQTRAAFDAKYATCMITLSFNHADRPASKGRDFKRSIPEIFDWLMELPDGYNGDAFGFVGDIRNIESILATMNANDQRRQRFYFLGSLLIVHGVFHGSPRFHGMAFGNVPRLMIEPAVEKLTAPYNSPHPMELLLTVRNGMASYEDDVTAIKNAVTPLLPNSSFERVWLHSPMDKKVFVLGERSSANSH